MTDSFKNWRDRCKDFYRKALQDLGLDPAGGGMLYSPGLLSLVDRKYLCVKSVNVDAYGDIEYINEYEYDSNGRTTRTYRNDVLIRENAYNSAGVKTRQVEYRNNGSLEKEETFDDDGNRLTLTMYNEYGRVTSFLLAEYDENGRLLSEKIGDDEKRVYEYNDAGFLIAVRNVTESTGETTKLREYEVDGKGRKTAEYLTTRDKSRELQTTFEYGDDGSRQETWYTIVEDPASAGGERLQILAVYDYDANDLLRKYDFYAPVNYESTEYYLNRTETYEWNENGDMVFFKGVTYVGTETEENTIENEYSESGKHLKETKTLRRYHDGSEEPYHEFSYVSYEAETNELGYVIHSKQYVCEDPDRSLEPTVRSEHFSLFMNSMGDVIGMDYPG